MEIMAKALIAPPTALPLSVADAKAHLRVETPDEDGYIEGLLKAAIAHVEAGTGVALISQTWRVYLDEWPDDCLVELPLHPVRSILAVTVFDAEGAPQALDANLWRLDAVSRPARLVFRAPPDPGLAPNGIEIDLRAGFGDTGNEVPDQLRRAVLLLVAHWHELRGSAPDAAMLGLEPAGYRRLIAPFAEVRL
jgi:uncharacterized phiE125 gp8 family phage protein